MAQVLAGALITVNQFWKGKKMNESKHTRTPWHFKKPPADSLMGTKIYGPLHRDGTDYAALCELQDMEDARFIVKACNSYDALLAACNTIKHHEEGCLRQGCGYDSIVHQMANTALALAQKEGGK